MVVGGDMIKNPLYKRLPREIKCDLGKYISLFLFIVLTIGIVSGFIVANTSIQKAYDESFSKYKIENGHIETESIISQDIINNIEKHEDIQIKELFYKEIEEKSGDIIRIYKPRKGINEVDLMSGKMPMGQNEIAIDRLYAENNEIKIGDNIKFGNREFKVTAFIAASDYSALFKSLSELMFDANHFSIGIMTDKGWDSIGNEHLHYCYAWLNNKNLSDKRQVEKGKDIANYYMSINGNNPIKMLAARPENQAITFTGDDFGSDLIMLKRLLYMIIILLAFIFAVTAKNIIDKESNVVGTLLASGYSHAELRRHYYILSVLITLVAAIIGNILGYTILKDIMAKAYYGSYSLPTYVTRYSGYAFVVTTLIPCLLILIINYIVVKRALRYRPLQFIRNDFKISMKNRVLNLPNWNIMKRIKIRVILSNKGVYLILFIGVLLGTTLIMFGNMFLFLLKNYTDEVINTKISDYQYVLKHQVPSNDDKAEKYAVTTLINKNGEKITVYGINKESRYFKNVKLLDDLSENQVLASSSYFDKYQLKDGDLLKLHVEFMNDKYQFNVKKSYNYPASLSLFMPIENFNKVFNHENNYYNGYFSNKKLDIDETMIATVVTKKDMTLIADQLTSSMGNIFQIYSIFSTILFVMVIYILTRIVIERNTRSISILKILGYSNNEIYRIYNRTNAFVVFISLLFSVKIASVVIKRIYYNMMLEYDGWLTYYMSKTVYLETIGIGIGCFIIVSFIIMNKIKKINMGDALTSIE